MEIPGALTIAKRFWRRKLWLVIPTLAGACAALVAVKNIQPRYRASAVILVEPQKIPTEFVKDTVTTGVQDRLRQIMQQVRQDEVLEPIVKELRLYPELLEQGLISGAVSAVRGSLSVGQNRRERTVSIAFSGTDRELVAPAANHIAEAVIRENQSLRETQTQGTSTFIAEQAAEAAAKLREMAEEIASLKKKWDGRLPEQRSGHQRTVRELERRLDAVEDSIENAQTRRLLLQRAGGAQLRTPTLTSAGSSQLDELRLQLHQLQSRYTEKHPDIIRLEQEIAALEELEATTPPPAPALEIQEESDPVLAAELEAIDYETQRLRSDRSQILGELARYRSLLQGSPEIEQELESLENQYKNYEGLYRSLLKKQVESGLAESLEARGQSEQFAIIQRAQAPSKPFSPNVLFLLLVGTGFGGVLGVGLVFLREETDQTFTDPDSLKEAFPAVKVLSVVPNLNQQSNFNYTRKSKKTA